MPFGGWFDQYYKEIFCPAIDKAGLDPKRSDDLYRPGTIVSDIWNYTKEAEIILADLTGRNPNVLYELGLAHAIAKPVILLTVSIEDIPFDLNALRIISYDKNESAWGELLREKITRCIEETLKEPLRSIPSAFVEVDESLPKKKITAHERDIMEIRQELELLKNDMRLSITAQGRNPIRPEDAQALIEHLIYRKASDEEIIRRIRALGAPRGWIEKMIESVKTKIDEDLPF